MYLVRFWGNEDAAGKEPWHDVRGRIDPSEFPGAKETTINSVFSQYLSFFLLLLLFFKKGLFQFPISQFQFKKTSADAQLRIRHRQLSLLEIWDEWARTEWLIGILAHARSKNSGEVIVAFERPGEMFKCDSADMCNRKISASFNGGARTPIGASGN